MVTMRIAKLLKKPNKPCNMNNKKRKNSTSRVCESYGKYNSKMKKCKERKEARKTILNRIALVMKPKRKEYQERGPDRSKRQKTEIVR